MTNGAAGATAAGAAAAIAQAIKASGSIIKFETGEFQKILHKNKDPLIVMSEGGLLSTKYHYLTNYRGLTFYCKSSTTLDLPTGAELIYSKKIWIPG
jgi:hypothetical protein